VASDIFMRIDDIEGESTDRQHPGWIEVLNNKLGLKQRIASTPSSAGGATAGKADFKTFNFIRPVDKASPRLALVCAAGTHIDEILVEECRAGGERVRYMAYRLRNCIIKRVMLIGGGIFPMELVDVDYGQIEWAYTQQSRSGGRPVGEVAGGWNREKNCRV
jgi:type VI secretion system secreted protein Hcp